MSLIGFALGAFLGSRLAPVVLEGGSSSPYAPLLAALGALIGGALVAVTLEGYALGLREHLIRAATCTSPTAPAAPLWSPASRWRRLGLRRRRPPRPGTRDLRTDVQRSMILRSLNAVMPPSGPC